MPATACRATVGQAVRALGVVEQRGLAVRGPHREVQVVARPALVVERLGHERRQPALVQRQLLDRRLEPVRPVGGAERVAVPQVDLELARGELVVGRHHLDAVGPQLPQRREQHVLRVALEAGHVDVAGALAVPAPARGRLLVLLEEVELQLGPDDRAPCPAPANCAITDRSTWRGLSADGLPSGLNTSAMQCATPGSQGIGSSVSMSGKARMSGRPVGQARPRCPRRHRGAWCRRRSGRTPLRSRRCGRTG